MKLQDTRESTNVEKRGKPHKSATRRIKQENEQHEQENDPSIRTLPSRGEKPAKREDTAGMVKDNSPREWALQRRRTERMR